MARETLKNLSPEDVKRLEVLSRVGKRINTPERFSEALQAVLDAVVESMEAERGALFLVQNADPDPTLSLFIDTTTEARNESGFRYSSTVVEKVWRERKPLAEVDTQINADLANKASIQAEGIRSVICVPLVGRESTLGVLYLDTRLSNAFTLADLQMLDVIADLASTALERARFFDALQDLNNELEGRVLQRTAEAEAARVEAERATRAKSLFLAKMSHELRTPLNGVLGLTEDLAQREQNPALRVQLQQIIDSARSLSTLINGVLDFSKLESDRVVLDVHTFSPEEAVTAALANVNYEATKKGLEVQVWVDGGVPAEVEGDSTRLKQILINLLSNAVKFTGQGYVRLLVSAPQPDRLLFSVADSGVGIAPEKQQEIFKPFSQADASTTREYGGTGLGLSISQSLCRLLGGQLELESKPGEGSRFTFVVPLKFGSEFPSPDYSGLRVAVVLPSIPQRQALERMLRNWGCTIVTDTEQAQLLVCKGSSTSRLPSVVLLDPGQIVENATAQANQRHLITPVTRSILRRAMSDLLNPQSAAQRPVASTEFDPPRPPQDAPILVVEDHEINRLVIKKMLDGWGYACHLASDGESALSMAQQLRPRLILMDIEMPGQDGFCTTRYLRGQGLTALEGVPVPVLAVTAHIASDLRERCLASGMDDLLAKPISRKAIAERLSLWEQFLAGEKTRGEVRYGGFSELAGWPGKFLSPINSSLSTLEVLTESESELSLEEALKKLERFAFSAGLLEWGRRLVKLSRPYQTAPVKDLIGQFQQEWRALAPTLLS